jgi:aldose 1-epimerase
MTGAGLATVRLRDAEGSLEATFVPGANMLCCSLRHHGAELLAQNAGVDAYAQRGKTMGIPLLYPWANRLAAFDYTIAGRTVVVPHDPLRVALDSNGLPIHGVIGGRLAWALKDPAGPSVDSLTAHLSWSDAQPDLFEVFPFRHDLAFRAHLAAGRLEVEVTVHACGADVVPVAFGFHPYLSLPCAPRECWRIELPAMRGLQLDAQQIPTAPGQSFPARSFELAQGVFDDGFDEVSEPARFVLAGGERRLTLEFLEGYRYAQVYSPPDGPFICFEPMSAPANALRSGSGLHLLALGERYRAAFAVSIEALFQGA